MKYVVKATVILIELEQPFIGRTLLTSNKCSVQVQWGNKVLKTNNHIEHVNREVGKKEDDNQGHQHLCCLLPLVDKISSRYMSGSRPAIGSYLQF